MASYGHLIGYCYSAEYSDYIYVPIPKNASTYTSNIFYNLNFNDSYNFNYQSKLRLKIPIIVLKDPIERWISGMIEFLKRYSKEHNFNMLKTLDSFNNILFSKIVFDEHTLPQIEFLENLNLEKSIFFKTDENFSDNLNFFLNKNIKQYSYEKGIKSNIKTSNEQIIYDILKELSDFSDKNKILRDFYNKDYDLFNQVKYYEPN